MGNYLKVKKSFYLCVSNHFDGMVDDFNLDILLKKKNYERKVGDIAFTVCVCVTP